MSPNLKHFCQRWVINTIGVLVAANVVGGVKYDSFTGLLVASLLLGILNTFLRPVLMLFSQPFLIVTLGLFTLVIYALLLYWVGHMVKEFHVNGFWPAFWGGIVISLIALIANWLTGTGTVRFQAKATRSRRRRRAAGNVDDGKGPIIDV